MEGSQFWWEWPGPASFVERLLDHFRDGRNVVLGLPAYAPPGLLETIRRRAEHELDLVWEVLNSPDSYDPARSILTRFDPDVDRTSLLRPVHVARSRRLAGHIVLVDALTHTTCETWLTFAAEYEQACRDQPILERPLLLIVLREELASNLPRPDICLAVERWSGCVELLDLQLHAWAHMKRNRRLRGLHRRLAIAAIASVARWDPAVVELLAGEPLDRILDPMPLLRELAKDRGWDVRPSGDRAASRPKGHWWDGRVDLIDGREICHPAVDDEHGIARSIWSAQVSVLLPHVEEQRRQLLDRFSGVLRVPFRTQFGVIEETSDLEIGHIVHQLQRTADRVGAVLPTELRRARLLRDVRNHLSHLELVPLDLLHALGSDH